MGHSILNLVSALEDTYPQVAEHRGTASILDPHYGPTRYPNALPGSAPFKVYGRKQAREAVAATEKLVGTAANLIR
jgi:HEPN domain-containing protein